MFTNNRLALNSLKKTVNSISSKLAYKKSQRSLLDLARHNDICSSIRPKVGKVFVSPDFERLKLQQLDICRRSIIDISIQESDSDIESVKLKYKEFFTNIQHDVSKNVFLKLSKIAKCTETKILRSQKIKHENKLIFNFD